MKKTGDATLDAINRAHGQLRASFVRSFVLLIVFTVIVGVAGGLLTKFTGIPVLVTSTSSGALSFLCGIVLGRRAHNQTRRFMATDFRVKQ